MYARKPETNVLEGICRVKARFVILGKFAEARTEILKTDNDRQPRA